MYKIAESRNNRKQLAYRLPWAILIAPGVVLNKDGSLQQTIEYRGPDLFSSTEEEENVVVSQVNNALRRLGSGWTIFVELQKRVTNFYPESAWPSPVSQMIDDERKKKFKMIGNHFSNKQFMTFVYMPPPAVESILKSFFTEGEGVNFDEDVKTFQNEVKRITGVLSSIFPFVKHLNDDETLTYLHSTISTKNHKVNTPKKPIYLDYILPDQPITGGVEPKIGESFYQIVTIKGFPLETISNIFRALGSVACEFRWVSRFICLSKEEAIKENSKYSREWFSKRKHIWAIIKEALMNEESSKTDVDAEKKSVQCDQAVEMIQGGDVSGGYYTTAVVLWHEDKKELERNINLVEDVINSAGFTSLNETLNVNTAWMGTIPGNCYANVRRPLINSLDFSQMIPTSADYDGQSWNKYLNGPALFVAKTESNMPFWFSPHVEDVGHMMVIGPTGAGKSVFLNLMANCFQRYKNHRVYFFDKGHSAYINTLLNGGQHYDLGDNKELAFQPLRLIDDENIRSWAQDWILENMLDDVKSPEIKKELWDALNSLSGSPEHQRTLTHLNALLQNEDIRAAVQTYTIDGALGYLLDSERDMMSQNRWQCFEMGHLMEYIRQGVKPTLSYLFHEIDRNLTGDPTAIFIDESWTFFDDETSQKKLKQWLKELRKKKAFVVFGTQSIADANNSAILHTLIESCPTRVFLPNKKALNQEIYDLYKSFGLNETQIDIISKAIPKREYYIQSDIGNRLIDLDLGPISLAVCGSSSKEDIKKMQELCTSDEEVIRPFLEYKGVYEN